MKIVVLMTGTGNRFKEAHYVSWKPTITLLGKPIYEYIVEMFDPYSDFLFLIREDKKNDIPDLLSYTQKKKISVEYIKGHKKGPVYTITQSQSLRDMDPTTPIMICYCDFFINWDFAHFKQFIKSQNNDGVIPVYNGFHPHLLHPTLYAALKVDGSRVVEVKEKTTYFTDKMKNLYSPGLYYFKNRDILLEYSQRLIKRDDMAINDEHYVSLLYQLMIESGLKVGFYKDISHFAQLGTPEDFKEIDAHMNIASKREALC